MTLLVGLYLAAVVAANLTIAAFGPSAAIVVAFLFIGLDLTARDRLHDAWRGRQLVLRMGALIAAGGALSYLLNAASGPIAVASTVAFVAAATTDGVVYALLGERSRMLRINGSNVVSSGVDSLVFPTLAFGGFLPLIVVGQFVAKVAGGFAWSLVIARDDLPLRRRPA